MITPSAASASVPARLTAVSDMTETGEFGIRELRVTDEAIQLHNEAGALLAQIPLADVETARHRPMVGGGQLVVRTKRGQDIGLVYYSQTLTDLFSDAARGIEQAAQDEPITVALETKIRRCPGCQRVLSDQFNQTCTQCAKKGRALVRLFSFLRPYTGSAVMVALTSILITSGQIAIPYLQRDIIDGLTGGTATVQSIGTLAVIWVGILALLAACQIVIGRSIGALGVNIAADLRAKVFRAVEFLNLQYFDKKQVGAITSRVTQDTERIWFFLVDGAPFLLRNVLVLVGVTVAIFSVDWMLALAVLAPMPIIGGMSYYFWKPMSQVFHRLSQKMARMHIHLNEALSGIRVVKAFVREEHEYDRFTQRNNELREVGVYVERWWNTTFGIMTFFISIGAVINWFVGGYFVIEGRITLGQLVMVSGLLGLLYEPLMWFARISNWFSRAMAGAQRVFEVIDTPAESEPKPEARHDVQGAVTFENVRFGYDKSNPILKKISFDVQEGEMIGLVGHSGAGKSTTINLLCRFYEPDGGRILIDGKDYRDLDMGHFRQQIGIVLQDPFLFAGSIAENIAYGKPKASMDEIMEAAKAANAHDFILSKPDGYDTVIGERGTRLSGGEKQRLSIARAILHDPRILILDEATSSVDVETERMIQEAIQRLVTGRTTFAIAHRLSTLRNANRLIVLDRGEIAEIGTHEELMKARGAFYRLVKTQSAINEIIGVGN